MGAYLLRPGGIRCAAELVSWSALPTPREVGCQTVLMTSTYPAGESYAAFRDAGRLAFHVPVAARTRVTRINGKNLAESVEIQNLDSGVRRTVHWDTVITTGDWIPDDELARSAGLGIDPATRGPASTAPFAPAHPAFSPLATCCTLSTLPTSPRSMAARRRPGPAMAAHPPRSRLRRHPDRRPAAALDRPQILRPGDSTPARHRLLAWPGAYVPVPHVQVIQDGKVLASRRLPRPAPGRVFRIPSSLLTRAGALSTEGTIHITLANAPKP